MSGISKKRTPLLICTLMLLSPATAYCQTASPTELIERRQSIYREIGTAYKAIRDESAKVTPMRFAMKSSARRILSALLDVKNMFPTGTGPDSGVETEALATIWSKPAEFDQNFEAALAEAEKLSAVMSHNDIKALRAQLKALGGKCKSCHNAFRLED